MERVPADHSFVENGSGHRHYSFRFLVRAVLELAVHHRSLSVLTVNMLGLEYSVEEQ